MDVKVLRLAQIEFEEAVTHYESEQKGLGERFRTEVLRPFLEYVSSLQRTKPSAITHGVA